MDVRNAQYDVLYVYEGRICTKSSKQNEIRRRYGTSAGGSAPRSGGASRGSAYAQQTVRLDANRQETRRSAPGRNAEAPRHTIDTDSYVARDTTARTVRFESPGSGGAAAIPRNGNTAQEGLRGLFGNIREKAKADESIVKKLAVRGRRISEYKHIIITVSVLLVLAFIFALFLYKTLFVIKNVETTVSSAYTEEEIIRVAAIPEGTSLYSFSSSRVESEITFRCPYIKSVDIGRRLPNSVILGINEDTAVYWADIWGDITLLSGNLRVLEVTTKEEAEARGLTELIIPAVKYSVAGRVLVFAEEKNDRYIRKALSDIAASALAIDGRIGMIDLSSQFDIRMRYNGIYSVFFGTDEGFAEKLSMCHGAIFSGKLEENVPANIVLEGTGAASVRYSLVTEAYGSR